MNIRQAVLGELWSAQRELENRAPLSTTWTHVWTLFLLKRFNDHFPEQEDAVAAAGAPPYASLREQKIRVPDLARWNRLLDHHLPITSTLNQALNALEVANPYLQGMFRWVDFSKFTSAEAILRSVVVRLSQMDLSDLALGGHQTIGEIAEAFLERVAEAEGKRGGEFFTPSAIVRLAVELANPAEGMAISDPACGLGRMLLACADYVKARALTNIPGHHQLDLQLEGQEKNAATWAVCRANLLLHGLASSRIELGDTLTNPLLVRDGRLVLYDRVVSTPPFSSRGWGADFATHDPFVRFQFGVPSKGNGDYAFLEHIIATLKPNGVGCVVMPHGVLFRGGVDLRIRRRILEADLFEAVIGLPPNLFYGTTIPTIVVIVNKSKPVARQAKVLIVDASENTTAGKRTHLAPETIDRIKEAYRAFRELDGFSRVVSIGEIEQQGFDLSISRYVRPEQEAKQLPVEAALAGVSDLERRRDALSQEMDELIRTLLR